jgi:tetratricopeptide (TPR) repeat protein
VARRRRQVARRRQGFDEHTSLTPALQHLGQAVEQQGDLARALALYQECLPLYRELTDAQAFAGTLCDQARVALAQGNRERAASLYEESLGLYRSLWNTQSVEWVGKRLRELGRQPVLWPEFTAPVETGESLWDQMGRAPEQHAAPSGWLTRLTAQWKRSRRH